MIWMLALLTASGAPVSDGVPWDPLRVFDPWPTELPDPEPWSMEAHRAAQERLETGDQFLHKERLGEVVVRPEVQSLDPFVQFVARCQENDGKGDAAFAEAAKNAEPIAPRKHDVEQHRVEGLARREVESFLAGAAELDDEARFFETGLDESGDLGLVFDDEDAHH